MDHRITQCPRCGTSFRVTEAHLAVAAGAVRCGSCLHIFNARDHWAEEKPAPEPEPQHEEDDEDLVIDDDALFDDNTPLFADEKPAERTASLSPLSDGIAKSNVVTGNFPRHNRGAITPDAPLYNAVDEDFAPIEDDEPEQISDSFNELDNWEREIGASFGRVQDLDEELSASDEEWTQNLLRDDEPPATPKPDRQTEQEGTLDDHGLIDEEPGEARVEPVFGDIDTLDTPHVLDTPHALDTEEPFADIEPPTDEPEESDEPEQPLDDLASGFSATSSDDEADEPDFDAEFLSIPSASTPAPAAVETKEQEEPPQGDLTDESAEPEETVVTDTSYGGPLYADQRQATASDTGHDPLASLDRLGSEPLQIHQFKHEPRWPQVLWGLGLIAMLALLAGQYVHANFDALARGPARPWLAKACGLAGCALPPQSDIAQIRSGNLIVRSHPSQAGALAVDAIITNQAPFPQPYPQLQLQFTDLNGTPVAGRRFRPEEYLAGELSGASLMPVQQPVHIALELVDPGPQAVNYSLTVVPPTPAP